MTISEFSDGFDVLVNSYRRIRSYDNQEATDSIEFNEYEKSFYLTKAQEELVRSLYNGRNSSEESFESTEEMRRYLSNIVLEETLSPASGSGLTGVSSTSKFFELPSELWFIIYEHASLSDAACDVMAVQDVYPVRHDEYHRIKRNPFRGASSRRALRLDVSDNMIEIVSKKNVVSYFLRYIRRLRPIILTNLPNHLTINDESNVSECELHEALHQRILELAVMNALRSKGISVSNNASEKN